MTTAINEFFELDGQRRALDAYSRSAAPAWSVAAKLKLYDLSRCAFPSNGTHDERTFSAFETIYDELRRCWQVFRSSVNASPWPAKTVYRMLRDEFAGFSRCQPVTLPTFNTSPQSGFLLPRLAAMRGIKSNANYPDMTVSKFLHFYNPKLFPIYDTDVVCNKVFKRFKVCYQQVESTANAMSAGGDGVFLLNYIRWASSLMKGAHPGFMLEFVSWVESEVPPRQFEAIGRQTVSELYATAFEFTAIGAAVCVET